VAGLDPAIQEPRYKLCEFPWIPGTRPGMTIKVEPHHLNASGANVDFYSGVDPLCDDVMLKIQEPARWRAREAAIGWPVFASKKEKAGDGLTSKQRFLPRA
jgi:hypothetical protein